MVPDEGTVRNPNTEHPTPNTYFQRKEVIPMVSSTPALPVFPVGPGNNDSPPVASPESGHESESTPSFASQLNQRLSRPKPDNTARPSQARRSDASPDAQGAKPGNEASN